MKLSDTYKNMSVDGLLACYEKVSVEREHIKNIFKNKKSIFVKSIENEFSYLENMIVEKVLSKNYSINQISKIFIGLNSKYKRGALIKPLVITYINSSDYLLDINSIEEAISYLDIEALWILSKCSNEVIRNLVSIELDKKFSEYEEELEEEFTYKKTMEDDIK